ncbi:M13 family metallopeptidase [Qipengyuania sp. XHP0211]|uniref:M13 family metallopeptidase n=1 Tax=Qipengyuania sp. XHP0211 TaxID=3038079 RepID=UPI00241F768A|nr:M13 family metallopeptidase [Qipengyuania sp. XHP0211]MDG5751796.1 M13 family metallopeptidase [Qipengyuania sp. XHP0211]
MIRTMLAAGASALALGLATPALADDHTEANMAEETNELPTMSFGEWGFDPATLSPDVDPGDDFFAYANQEWLDANPLPAEFSSFGAFNLLREKSTSDVKTLVDELNAKDPASLTANEKRIVAVYDSYLDTDAIDAAGISAAQPYLERIQAADSIDALLTLWATPGYPSPLGGGVNVDAKETDRYSVYLSSGGLGLPDRDYYTDTSEKGENIKAKYKEYLTFLMGKAGYEDPAAAAMAVYAFEDTIARTISSDRAASRNVDLFYNPFTPAELGELAGDFPIETLIEASGFGEADRFVVTNLRPSAERAEEIGLDAEAMAKLGKGFTGMLELLGTTDLATLKAWTIKEFLDNNAAILGSDIDEADFAFYGTLLRGTPEQRPRWKRAIGETESQFGELLGASYVERYFPPASKEAMDELVANLRIALAESLAEIDWMSEASKKQAMAKLDSFDPKIGYRDNLETYEGLDVKAGDPLGNRMAAAHWAWRDMLDKLGGPIDRTEWGMLPQTVNAYYNPLKNEIVFPAGILQQPFFGPNADPAVNYGAIGGVIGHEIGHGFDDQGSKFSATGALENWWTDEDRANFDGLTDALVEQYNGFCPLDDGETCVNGRLTLGENIGDLGGLSMAYRAYKLATEGKDVPVIDGLTGDQRFFLAWAQVWRTAQRDDALRQQLRTDPHSPAYYRVNGVVRNFDEWYEAFNVTPEDDLYLPPEERIRIW